MAAGDLKGEGAIVIEVTAGAAITKGKVLHIEDDGYWDPVEIDDVGKFGVAVDASANDEVSICIWGRVEVLNGAVAVKKGEYVEASGSGTIAPAEFGAEGELVGTAMEAIGAAEYGTIWLGLVG